VSAVGWDPQRYLTYADLRLRPGLDLAARIPTQSPDQVVDLGCGPGQLTLHLAERWPHAAVAGIDDDPGMLAEAESRDTTRRVSWLPGDIATWTSAQRIDVIVANASLHWVDDHPRLLNHLLGQLTPGGVLAFQMPDNHDQPSHTSVFEVVREGPWAARLEPLLRTQPVLPPQRYHRLLAPQVAHLDIWQTTYWQALEGDNPVLTWLQGSMLRPLLEALGGGEQEEFVAAVADRLRAAYPADNGTTLFPFRRLFVVAERR
jgi:trans-aconitate 2-methyltransferase